MLKTFAARGFKSLFDVGPIEMAPLTVFFGPNAVGKSNLLDALLLLSRLATEKTVAEAVEGPVRGLPLELFGFPRSAGLSGLLTREKASCSFETDLLTSGGSYRYEVDITIAPPSGALSVEDEFLALLDAGGAVRGDPSIIRHGEDAFGINGARDEDYQEEKTGLNHTILSDRRFSGERYPAIERARSLLASFRSYYLDPRTAMRQPQPPREVDDIGPLGEYTASFLYRLRAEKPKVFQAIRRSLCTLIPSVDDLVIDLDARQGVVNIEIHQDGTPYSSRIVSEGTLRVLALLCVAMNPWGGTLVAFEEPENGVHPRRIELIAEILGSLALDSDQQVILTTHSPLFCSSVIRLAQRHPDKVRLYRTVRQGGRTRFEAFDSAGPLFTDAEIRDALTAPSEDQVFEGLLLRGLLDG